MMKNKMPVKEFLPLLGVTAAAFIFNTSCQAEIIKRTDESASAVAMSIFSGIFNMGIALGTVRRNDLHPTFNRRHRIRRRGYRPARVFVLHLRRSSEIQAGIKLKRTSLEVRFIFNSFHLNGLCSTERF